MSWQAINLPFTSEIVPDILVLLHVGVGQVLCGKKKPHCSLVLSILLAFRDSVNLS